MSGGMTECCKAAVWDGWGYRRCTRKAVVDGYCRQHSPEAVEARKAKREAIDAEKDAAWDAKFHAAKRDVQRLGLWTELVAALVAAHDCLLDYPVGFEAVLQQARDVLKRAKEIDNG